jgi:hypothetical protein
MREAQSVEKAIAAPRNTDMSSLQLAPSMQAKHVSSDVFFSLASDWAYSLQFYADGLAGEYLEL